MRWLVLRMVAWLRELRQRHCRHSPVIRREEHVRPVRSKRGCCLLASTTVVKWWECEHCGKRLSETWWREALGVDQ